MPYSAPFRRTIVGHGLDGSREQVVAATTSTTELSILGLILACILTSLGGAAPGEDDVARFLREFPEASQRHEERLRTIQGNARIWAIDSQRHQTRPITQARFALANGFEKAELKRYAEMKDGREVLLGEVIYCVGENSGFQLSRRAGTKPYIVDQKGATHAERSRYRSAFGQYIHAPYEVLGSPLPRTMSYPNFRVVSASTRSVEGQSVMDVVLEYGKDPSNPNRLSLVVEPDGGWRVREWVLQAAGINKTFRTRVEYESDPARRFLPRLVTMEREEEGRVEHALFSDWSEAPAAPDEFHMTSYGLPDLNKPASRPSSNRLLWLILLAVVLLAIALFLRHLSRRKLPAHLT